MAGSKDKRAVVEQFFHDLEALEANPKRSSFSSVPSEAAAQKVLKAVPNVWEPPFVQRLYRKCLKKGGVRSELKSIKPNHFDAMAQAFKDISRHLGTEKAGLIHEIEVLILWECAEPGSIGRERFLRNLGFVLTAERFTNIPNLAKKRASFEPLAQDQQLVALARRVLERVEEREQQTGNELFCYWALVYLLLLDRSEPSEAFLDTFLPCNKTGHCMPGMRNRLFLVNRFLLANKRDPYFKALDTKLRNAYPKDWLDTYEPQ